LARLRLHGVFRAARGDEIVNTLGNAGIRRFADVVGMPVCPPLSTRRAARR
jgi:hypothetical protein